MDAETAERFAALEERVARLEGGAGGPDPETFWALHGLRDRLTERTGGVLFTGSVHLPTGEHYEWQQGARTEALLEADWAESGAAFAALGHPVRLQLLRHVLAGTHAVTELQELDSVGTTGQLYHHLKQLVAAGWLRTASRGRYQVPGERIVPLLVLLAAAHPPMPQ
ncbi:ArsR/SmtB family transcription factor [Amycolatopsis anabasis]|uniref:ArsR/SmtB family transcription factor n=1 Tax=Amycolatopsis anabasis TaxID=1840409 RepID=UPI00131E11E9|nr:helix-turn-helix domain-containing protein [Amycolatopsis anabasis]